MNLTDINQIKDILGRNGFHFSKSLGQNFLIASWVPEEIAFSSGAGKEHCVLEIGPGIGCLTYELSKNAGKVVAIEADKALKPVLEETLSESDNVQILYGDALKADFSDIIDNNFEGLTPCVCANLPYNITSPILTKLIEEQRFESITVMIQKEVAQRICAAPGSRDYCAFGIFVQWFMETEKLFDVSPSCFIPQPKVTSSVIRLKRRNKFPTDVIDENLMFRIVRAAFNQRRKTLINALNSGLPELEKNIITNAVVQAGISVTARGETLTIPEYALLSDIITDCIKNTK